MGPAALRIAGLALLACLLIAAAHYPADPLIVWPALGGYALLIWWRPRAWLFAVPALLPVFDAAPHTGWFYLGEIDLLLLATAAVGYLRTARDAPKAMLPRPVAVALALFAAAWTASMAAGLLPLQPADANAFAGYFSSWNALRVYSGFAWAVILLPLFLRTAGDGMHSVGAWFVPGMLAGMGMTALTVVWERAMFPGLLNFAADYRPTGPFSSMHTGGAALDAYLALSLPFIGLWLGAPGARLRHLAALGLLLLGCYASFAIFSRDMYLAFAGAALAAGGLAAAHRLRRGAFDVRALLLAAGLLALTATVLFRVFATSGYRGLGASITLMVAAMILSASPARLAAPGAAVAGVLAAGMLAALLEKGSYIAVAVSALAFGAGAPLLYGARSRNGAALPVAAFAALAVGAAAVAHHWGGPDAAPPALAVAALAVTIVAVSQMTPRTLWQPRAAITATLFFAVVLATLIPAAASYYLGTRFATTAGDLDVRVRHWTGSLAMMDRDPATSLFGMGLGSYPEAYYWRNSAGETPGRFSFVDTGDANRFLRLGVARYQAGYGEALRILQRVDAPAGGRYLFSADVRRNSAKAVLQAAVCERWLLYPQNCSAAHIRLGPPGDEWRHYSVILRAVPANPSIGILQPPTQLELAAAGSEGGIDIDNVSLVDLSTREELVRNGAFSRANEGWFFSSDRSHLPWHAKNVVVHIVFEMGWVGLAAAVFVLITAAGVLARRALRGDASALVYVAALTGFLMVGLFDSLFDVPRLTLAFFLVLIVACATPRPPRRSGQPRARAAQSGK
ncbi:hypothetical protein [Pseudoduganella sp. GCM10020061]|uniref:hypothetical protein n=1 Tax=Pseudoduganella sp. GCM10020061 TaxID=3317345 RepID=UPI0036430C86